MSSTAASWNQARDSVLARPSDWLLDCSYTEEHAAGFALGTLEPDEQLRVAHHISWCPTCARLLHEARKTVGYLPFLAPQATPPASAKAGLFAKIANERTSIVAADVPAAPEPTVGLYDDLLRRPLDNWTASDIAPSQRRASRRRFAWDVAAAPLAAVPLVFALAIVGGFALHTQNKLNDQIAYTNSLQDKVAQADDRPAPVEIVPVSTFQKFDLESAGSALGSSSGGTLYASEDQRVLRLSVWSLEPNQGYDVYVETANGEFQRVSSFRVNPDGTAIVNLTLKNPLDEYRGVHVARSRDDGESTIPDTTVKPQDLLWRDLDGNLGDVVGTEANLIAH